MTDDLIARLRRHAIARSSYALQYADGRTVIHPVCEEAADALKAQARRIAELEHEFEITSRYASKLEDVLRLINLASLKPNGSKEECGVIAREAINGHI
jgi:hypothetical protein